MYAILLVSIIGLAVVIERFWFLVLTNPEPLSTNWVNCYTKEMLKERLP